MSRCWIALGGNIGDVRSTLEHALQSLDRPGVRLVKASRFYDTTPISVERGQRYLNGAAELEVFLPPERVLDELQSIEAAAGRERTTRWGARTLDLDLLIYEDLICETPRLTLPHPALWYRRFVLDPLTEIAPGLLHPVFGASIAELKKRLMLRPLPVALQGDHDLIVPIRLHLESRFGVQICWATDIQEAAIVFRRMAAEWTPVFDGPQVVELPATETAFSLASLVMTAALDEPIPLD